MKNIGFRKYVEWGLTLVLGVAAFLFWWQNYPFALVYQEQYQLFLFDSMYVSERIANPGGVAAVISEFLVQYYNHPTLGAMIQAALLVTVQLLVWAVMKRNTHIPSERALIFYTLSFVPSLVLWGVLGNENVLVGYQLSLILALVAMLSASVGKYRWGTYIWIVPLLYWCVGSLVLLYSLFILQKEIRRKTTGGLCLGITVVLYGIFCVVASGWLVPYPVRRLFAGLHYFRYVDVIPYSLIIVPAVVWLATGIHTDCLRWIPNRKMVWAVVVTWVVMIGGWMVLLPWSYDARTYELMEYDYLVRRQQWNAIIKKAEEKQPDLPMSVCATNLALGMNNALGHRTFQFFQNGTEGLLPKFERDFTSTLLSGEVCFHLGLVNTAQRYAFEAMEAIPNYNKSGRVIKRLAETNLINGQYEVAKKYLRMLEKTVFYRKWAKDKLSLISDEGQIDNHLVYGRMRKLRLEEDFLFSDIELDKIFGQLFMRNSSNVLAMQYLLVYPLLNRDMDSFMRYLTVVQRTRNYNPPVCQEGIAFAYMQRQQTPPAGMVNENIMRNFKYFVQVYSSAGRNSSQLEAFKGTLWYYLMKE